MYAYIYVCMFIFLYVCMYVYLPAHILHHLANLGPANICVYTCACVRILVCASKCVCNNAMDMYVCMRMCLCAYFSI